MAARRLITCQLLSAQALMAAPPVEKKAADPRSWTRLLADALTLGTRGRGRAR
jgi:hypothetical protein